MSFHTRSLSAVQAFTTCLVASGAALLAATPASAQSSVSIYGIVDSGLVYQRGPIAGGESRKGLTPGGYAPSRLGYRGTEELGGGYQAFFELESGLDMRNGETTLGAFFGRLALVGLSSKKYGSVSMGRQLTPFYRMAVVPSDPFSVGLMGCSCVLMNTSARFSNSVSYMSPDMSGAKVGAFYTFGEGTAGRHLSLAISYTLGPLYLAAGYYDTSRFQTTAASHGTTVSATYGLPGFKVFGSFEAVRSEANGVPGVTKVTTNYNVYRVGASIPMGVGTVLLGLGYADDQRKLGTANASALHSSIAYTHALSKRTTLYTSIGHVRNRGGASFSIMNASTAAYGTTGFDIGMRHTF